MANKPEPPPYHDIHLPRVKPTLEERQAEMRLHQRGNPNLKKGEKPYNLKKETFSKWMKENPDYERKTKYQISDIVQMFLNETPRVNNPESKTRLKMLLDGLFKAGINVKNKNQVAATLALLNRAFGKEAASDADLEAIKKGGLTLVYVNRQEIDPEIPVIDGAAQHALPPPEFIDAEVLEGENGPS